MGVVAKMYPDVRFVVYHSAIEFGAVGEGPYEPANTQGTDRLVRAVLDNDVASKNVYGELGSVWAQVMDSPEMAQHVIGKLLKYVGEDNVLRGSECIWFGSPQPQIEAFRTFQISTEFREKFGYPEITISESLETDRRPAGVMGLPDGLSSCLESPAVTSILCCLVPSAPGDC